MIKLDDETIGWCLQVIGNYRAKSGLSPRETLIAQEVVADLMHRVMARKEIKDRQDNHSNAMAIMDAIRSQVIEECAKVADQAAADGDIAACRIRALITTTGGEPEKRVPSREAQDIMRKGPSARISAAPSTALAGEQT